MPQKQQKSDRSRRDLLAGVIVGFAFLVIGVVGVAAINKADDPMTVMSALLPVIASWVGTVLAFYFGRENFEAANQQVRELVGQLSPDQRSSQPVRSIMREFGQTTTLQIPEGKKPSDIPLSDLRAKFVGTVSRLLVVDAQNVALYLIHDARLDRYVADGNPDTDSLQVFLDKEKTAEREYGPGKAFVVVSEETPIREASEKMQAVKTCQDIIVTGNGKPDSPVTGWVSNVRLARFIEM